MLHLHTLLFLIFLQSELFLKCFCLKDYYETLNLKKTATVAEIKKAYRQLSLKHHPDRNTSNKSSDKFSKIVTAYEVLVDPEKRRIYDVYGEEGLKNSDHDIPDIFDFMNPFNFDSRHQRKRQKEQAPSIKVKLYASLYQLYFGDLLDIQFKRPAICLKYNECVVQRKGCAGPGIRIITQNMGPTFVFQNQIPDESCIDVNKGIKTPCAACPNGLLEPTTFQNKIYIEPGAISGDILTIEGGGYQKIGHEPGNIQFVIAELPHPWYKREGADLKTTIYIDLLKALQGFTVSIPHINHKTFTITKSGITHDGQIDILEGRGMPLKDSSTDFGNLHVTYRVKYPTELKPDSVDLIAKALSNVNDWKYTTY